MNKIKTKTTDLSYDDMDFLEIKVMTQKLLLLTITNNVC